MLCLSINNQAFFGSCIGGTCFLKLVFSAIAHWVRISTAVCCLYGFMLGNMNALASTQGGDIAIIDDGIGIAGDGIGHHSGAKSNACSGGAHAHTQATAIVFQLLLACSESSKSTIRLNGTGSNIDTGIIIDDIAGNVARQGNTGILTHTHGQTYGHIENFIF